jgi:hypothetical protein
MNKQNHECKNEAGRMNYVTDVLQFIPYKERFNFIDRNSDSLERDFCEKLCPIGKWYRRYEKSLEIKLNKIRQSGTEFIQDVLPEKSKQESYTRFL